MLTGSRQTLIIEWSVHTLLIAIITRVWTNAHLLRSFWWSNVLVDFFEFLPIEFAAYSKPPSRNNHRKVVLSKDATTWPGCGSNSHHTIKDLFKLHTLGRLLAARIGILPFFFSNLFLAFSILRKKNGKMPILAAKSRRWGCSLKMTLLWSRPLRQWIKNNARNAQTEINSKKRKRQQQRKGQQILLWEMESTSNFGKWLHIIRRDNLWLCASWEGLWHGFCGRWLFLYSRMA